MRVRFVTVAESNRRFGEMALLWAWSIRNRAGRLSGQPCTVLFNDLEDADLSARLVAESDADVRTLPRLSASHPEQNKFNAFRYEGIEDDDWVVLSDADMAVCADLDGLADRLDAADFDIGVTPAGIRAEQKLPLVRRLDRLLVRQTGRSRAELERWVHPWFVDHAPRTRWPYLSGGLFVVRGSIARAFGEEVLEQTRTVNAYLRERQPNVWNVARNWYNRRVHGRGWWTDPLIIGYWFMSRLADQAAITAAMVKMDLRPAYLDHTYNWRYAGSGHGEELPVRFLHYYGSLAREAQADLLAGDWDEAYASDANPGRAALADVVQAYRADPATGGAFEPASA